MLISFKRGSQCFCNRLFPTINDQVAAQIDDINDHKEEARIATTLRDFLHGSEDFRRAFLDGGGTCSLYSTNCKDIVLDGKFLEIGGNEGLDRLLVHVAGGGNENSLTILLYVLTSNGGQL